MSKELKGVYNLNPTSMVMKQGSRESRAEHPKAGKEYVAGKNPRMSEAHEAPADIDGVEHEVHSHEHPMMQTRHSHPRNARHSDGRRHEDDHYAVKQLKGMK